MERTVDLGPDRAEGSEDHAHCQHIVCLVYNLKTGEAVGVEMNAVPGIEPIGDDIFGIAAGHALDYRGDVPPRPRREQRDFEIP